MIDVADLSFRYRKLSPVLEGLSFTVEAGEIYGVIGPNGSGKTTLLKILSGLLTNYSGQIRLWDKDLKSFTQNDLARHIAVVPQETHVSFPFTAMDIVLMGRSPHLGRLTLEQDRDRDIALRAMEQTDTLQFAARPIQELSGGEKQRVILARALAQESRLLILDEPTAFLDIRHQIGLCMLLRRLKEAHEKTIIIVLHDLNLAAIYCSRLMLLHDRRIFRIGKPEEVVTYSNIKEAYSAEVYVGINDLTGSPYYVPMQENRGQTPRLPGFETG